MESNSTMLYVMHTIVGAPSTDYESFVLYLTACAVSVAMVFFVAYLFKLVASLLVVGEHR